MSGTWQSKPLREIAKITYGHTAKASSVAIGPRFLRITDIQNDQVDWESVPYCNIEDIALEKQRLTSGDIVFARTGATTGKSFLVVDPPDSVAASYLIRLRVLAKDVLPEYVAKYFQTQEYWEQVTRGSVGSTQGGFNASKLAAMQIPLPTLAEQKRIVAILDGVFARIDAAAADAEKNIANARELFDGYINSVFAQRGVGWSNHVVGDLAEHSLGKMLDKRKNRGTLRLYLRNLNVRWFEFDLSDLLEMRFEDAEIDRYSIQKGDLVICEGGYPGRAAIWDQDHPIFFQKALHRVRFRDPVHNRWFLFFLYLSESTGELEKHFSGAGIQHFTGKSLSRFQIPIAPTAMITHYLEVFDTLFEDSRRLEAVYHRKLAALAELKQSMLKKAFAGELTAKEAERELAAA